MQKKRKLSSDDGLRGFGLNRVGPPFGSTFLAEARSNDQKNDPDKKSAIMSFCETIKRTETTIQYLKNGHPGDAHISESENEEDEEEKEDEKKPQSMLMTRKYHSDPLFNWAIFLHKQKKYRDDSEFCFRCLKHLFTDTPDDANFACCHQCMNFQCLPCAVSIPNQVYVLCVFFSNEILVQVSTLEKCQRRRNTKNSELEWQRFCGF